MRRTHLEVGGREAGHVGVALAQHVVVGREVDAEAPRVEVEHRDLKVGALARGHLALAVKEPGPAHRSAFAVQLNE